MASNRGMTGVCIAIVFTILGACGGGGGGDASGGSGNTGGNNSPTAPGSNNPNQLPVQVGAFAYVLNAASANISAYSINETTGALSEIPDSPFAAGENPVDVAITPSGRFAYVVNANSGNVMGYSIDATTGALARVGASVEGLEFPVSIAMHPSGRALYVVSQHQSGPGDSFISAYGIDTATGLLSSIGTTVLPGYPESIAIDPAGRFTYVTGGAHDFYISVHAIDPTRGTLSEIAGSPYWTRGGNPHEITLVPSGRFAYVPTTDGVIGYEVNTTTGAVSQIAGSPFSPSYYISVHPSGKFAYGTEPGAASNLPGQTTTYAINDVTGALTRVHSTESSLEAFLAFSPSGKFVYGPIEASNSVYMGTVDPNTGALTGIGTIGAGTVPRAIGITSTYR